MSKHITMNDIVEQSNKLFNNKKTHIDDYVDLENNCYLYLSNINIKIQKCIEMFNLLIQDISLLLSREFPRDLILKTYSGIVKNIISNNPLKPISSFILNIYSNDKYRSCILKGDDEFFLNNSYVNNDGDKIRMMFQFKSCWKKLGTSDKDYIKNAMKTLVDISGQYVIERDDGNKIAEIIQKITTIKKCEH